MTIRRRIGPLLAFGLAGALSTSVLGGACCLCVGACADVSAEECVQIGGIFSGPETSCDTIACEPFGACCLPDLACELLPARACALRGGVSHAPCTDCGPAACPVRGACCLPDGSCLIRTHDGCQTLGGIYRGFGVGCAEASCFGACAFSSGLCRDGDSRLSCQMVGGLFQGLGTTCRDVTNPAVVQTSTFSFAQNGRRSFTFDAFDPLGGSRELARVEIVLEASVIAAVNLTNLGEAFIDTEAEVNEAVFASGRVLDARTLVPIDVDQLVIDCGAGFLLPPGASCDYGGVLTLGGVSRFVTDDPAGLERFLDPGIELTVTGVGSIEYDGQKVVFVVFPHRVEGMLRVRYEFVPVGACCVADGRCEDGVSRLICEMEHEGIWIGAGSVCAMGCPCPADLDGDGVVGFLDLVVVLSQWGACPDCPADIDRDGVVGLSDLLQMLSSWGACLR